METHAKLLKNDAENEDIQVFLEGTQLDKGSYTIADDGATLTVKITDKSTKRYRAWEKDDPDDTSAETSGTSVEVYIANTDKLAVGDVGDDELYSGYAFLGDTWSSPRIFRMPSPTERSDPTKDKYVMVMGGGMSMKRGIGSNVFVIDLDDKNIGKILKVIDIPDSDKNKITNSTPASPVVITPDMTPGIPWRGALVYINDYEGKVTKINLTSMKTGDDDNSIAIFDSTQIFDAQVDQSELSTNARYMYHSMDIAIGRDSNKVWLYMGTGDYEDPNMIPDETLGEPPILSLIHI